VNSVFVVAVFFNGFAFDGLQSVGDVFASRDTAERQMMETAKKRSPQGYGKWISDNELRYSVLDGTVTLALCEREVIHD